MGYKILILEDNEIDADLIHQNLVRSDYDYETKHVALKDDFAKKLRTFNPDLIIADYNLKSFDAYDALEITQEFDKTLPVVIISGTVGEEKAVNLIKKGAIDFIRKENIVRLPQISIRAIEEAAQKREREKAQQALRKEKNFTDKLLDSLSGIFCVLNSELEIERVNKKFLELLDYTREEVSGSPFYKFIAKEDHAKVEKEIQQIQETGEASIELRLQHKDGSQDHYLLTGTLLHEEETGYILGTGIDISDRVKAEREIKEALKEREILLTEVHHRVKNNLAVISGMMQLQIHETEQEQELLIKKLKDCQSRIKSMGLIHELLYQSNNFSHICLKDTVKRLVEEISTMTEIDKQMDVNVNLDTIDLNLNQAIPCILILNELLTNVNKHAFPEHNGGKIDLTLKEDEGRISLTVKDNGVGLPESVTIKNATSLGFKLVEVLTKQLKADLKYSSDGGSTFELTFEKSEKKGSGSSLYAQNGNRIS